MKPFHSDVQIKINALARAPFAMAFLIALMDLTK
jgi:hypothetical protein